MLKKYDFIHSFKIPEAKSGMQEHKNGKNTWTSIYFFCFMRLCSKSASCNRIPQVVSISVVFFKKAAFIIAMHGQKTLH